MIHNIWKKLTGQEHLYRMERSLQKKMLKCENEEQWEKLNQRRKKIRRQRHRIQTRCRMMAVAGIDITDGRNGKIGDGSIYRQYRESEEKSQMGTESDIESETDTAGEPAEILLSFTGDCILGTDEFFAWDTGLPAIITCTVQSIS